VKTKAALLKDRAQKYLYRISLNLQEGKTAEFIYNDRAIARQHWDQLQGSGVVAGLAIRTYNFYEEAVNEKNTTP